MVISSVLTDDILIQTTLRKDASGKTEEITILGADANSPENQPSQSSEVTFEMRLAVDAPEEGYHQITVKETGVPIYVSDVLEITQVDIADAKAIMYDGRAAIEFILTDKGGEKMRQLTRNHLNQKIAMFINGQLTAAPTIRAEISQKGIINGNFTMEEAQEIAKGLSAK